MYSMFSAIPVMYPHHGPSAVRAKEYAPPACGMAGDISARLQHRHAYRTVITQRASRRPPKPPDTRPKFQPKKSPEITAPTPSAQRWNTPAWRLRPLRPARLLGASRYASEVVGFSGSAPEIITRLAQRGCCRSEERRVGKEGRSRWLTY